MKNSEAQTVQRKVKTNISEDIGALFGVVTLTTEY